VHVLIDHSDSLLPFGLERSRSVNGESLPNIVHICAMAQLLPADRVQGHAQDSASSAAKLANPSVDHEEHEKLATDDEEPEEFANSIAAIVDESMYDGLMRFLGTDGALEKHSEVRDLLEHVGKEKSKQLYHHFGTQWKTVWGNIPEFARGDETVMEKQWRCQEYVNITKSFLRVVVIGDRIASDEFPCVSVGEQSSIQAKEAAECLACIKKSEFVPVRNTWTYSGRNSDAIPLATTNLKVFVVQNGH
jgi:hypothetical protein